MAGCLAWLYGGRSRFRAHIVFGRFLRCYQCRWGLHGHDIAAPPRLTGSGVKAGSFRDPNPRMPDPGLFRRRDLWRVARQGPVSWVNEPGTHDLAGERTCQLSDHASRHADRRVEGHRTTHIAEQFDQQHR